MRTFSLFFLLALNTFAAGPVIFGGIGGVPFNNTSSTAGVLVSGIGALGGARRFEVGPTVGVRLPLGFSVQGDALFRRQTLNLGTLPGLNIASTHSDSWAFPVMLKFTAGHQAFAPVLGAGISVRHINNFGSVPSYLFNGITPSNAVGFVAGAGLRFRLGPVDVTPEVRYTRWDGNSFSNAVASLLPLSRNEGSFLVGITF